MQALLETNRVEPKEKIYTGHTSSMQKHDHRACDQMRLTHPPFSVMNKILRTRLTHIRRRLIQLELFQPGAVLYFKNNLQINLFKFYSVKCQTIGLQVVE